MTKTITTETGDEFSVEDGLDLDSKEAMLDELAYIINDVSEYGIRGVGRGDRLVYLARVSFLASRIAWLESVPISMDELDARARKAAAKMALNRKVAAAELIRLEGGNVIEAENFDPAVHVRAEDGAQ